MLFRFVFSSGCLSPYAIRYATAIIGNVLSTLGTPFHKIGTGIMRLNLLVSGGPSSLWLFETSIRAEEKCRNHVLNDDAVVIRPVADDTRKLLLAPAGPSC